MNLLKRYFYLALALNLSTFLFNCSNSSDSKHPKNSALRDFFKLQKRLKLSGTPNGNRYFVNDEEQPLFDSAIFYNAHPFHLGYAVVSKWIDGKELWGVIDSKGKQHVDFIYSNEISDYEDGLFRVVKPPYSGYIDTTGKLIIPIKYRSYTHFARGMIKLENEDGKIGIISNKGKLIVPFRYDRMGDWGDGLSPVAVNVVIDHLQRQRWGYIDEKGNEVIACQYMNARPFSSGVALVCKGELWGLINKKNELISDFQYDQSSPAFVSDKPDPKLPAISESTSSDVHVGKYLILKKGKFYGMIDLKGNIVMPFEYKFLGDIDEKMQLSIVHNNRRGTYDLKTKKTKWYN